MPFRQRIYAESPASDLKLPGGHCFHEASGINCRENACDDTVVSSGTPGEPTHIAISPRSINKCQYWCILIHQAVANNRYSALTCLVSMPTEKEGHRRQPKATDKDRE